MTDPSPGIGLEPGRESTMSTPRWVKAFGIVGLVLVLLFVGLQVLGGGGHGPSRHTQSSGAGGQTPTSSVTEDLTPSGSPGRHTPLAGGH